MGLCATYKRKASGLVSSVTLSDFAYCGSSAAKCYCVIVSMAF